MNDNLVRHAADCAMVTTHHLTCTCGAYGTGSTTHTTDLTDFLLARITEDEKEARRQLAYIERHGTKIPDWEPTLIKAAERVLAECEAKRRIIARFEYRLSTQAENSTDPRDWDDLTRHYYEVVRDLASVHADHPDYDESWRV